MKLIFVASDFSGLGKGTFSASLGRLLKSRGIDVRVMKCDLYFNYDAGTISPGEHGEVYVLADGAEVDQDFGIYERFLGIECNRKDYSTSGQVFHQIYLNERAGKYLGQTVSVEHVIDEIKQRIYNFGEQCEVGIVELGATIGDIKGVYFLEACRQIMNELRKDESIFCLLSHFPYLSNVHELKTMGCQRSVNELRSKGIKTDIIIARTGDVTEVADYELRKIEKFCEVPHDAVFVVPDLTDEYLLPRHLSGIMIDDYVASALSITLGKSKLEDWYKNIRPRNDLKIALIGKYPHADAYVSIKHQLRLLGVDSITYMPEPVNLERFDAVILPGGWGERGVEEIIHAAEICRRRSIPCLGICLGLQLMVIEYARNVLGIKDATSAEFDEDAKYPVVVLQEEQKKLHSLGGTARLGNWTTLLTPNSKLAKIYGTTQIVQRHRHRYEITPDVDFGEFRVVGRDKRTSLIEAMELAGHPFYIGVQAHPEFSTSINPIFQALVHTALEKKMTKNSQQQWDKYPAVQSGKSNTFLENIDINNEEVLRRITQLPGDELARIGINEQQQEHLSRFFEVLDEKKEVMDRIEADMSELERQMRVINLDPNHIEGRQLTADQVAKLESLEREIERKKAEMRDVRDHYQILLMQYDEIAGDLGIASIRGLKITKDL